MLSLPNEIILPIAKQLDYQSLSSLSSSCTELYYLFKELRHEQKQTIPWKIIVHIILNNPTEFKIDRSWVIIGYNNFFQNPHDDIWEYCPHCDEVEPLNEVNMNDHFLHGEDLINEIDIVTHIEKGIGGDKLDKIINSIYLNNEGNKVVPLTSIYYDFFNFGINIDYTEDKTFTFDISEAILEIRDLEINEYKTDQIEDYCLHGLYLEPSSSNTSPYMFERSFESSCGNSNQDCGYSHEDYYGYSFDSSY